MQWTWGACFNLRDDKGGALELWLCEKIFFCGYFASEEFGVHVVARTGDYVIWRLKFERSSVVIAGASSTSLFLLCLILDVLPHLLGKSYLQGVSYAIHDAVEGCWTCMLLLLLFKLIFIFYCGFRTWVSSFSVTWCAIRSEISVYLTIGLSLDLNCKSK